MTIGGYCWHSQSASLSSIFRYVLIRVKSRCLGAIVSSTMSTVALQKEASARGVLIVTRRAAQRSGMDLRGARVSIQGSGNAGSIAARLFREAGCKIVAMSSRDGGIYHKDGLDPDAVALYRREHRSVKG